MDGGGKKGKRFHGIGTEIYFGDGDEHSFVSYVGCGFDENKLSSAHRHMNHVINLKVLFSLWPLMKAAVD